MHPHKAARLPDVPCQFDPILTARRERCAKTDSCLPTILQTKRKSSSNTLETRPKSKLSCRVAKESCIVSMSIFEIRCSRRRTIFQSTRNLAADRILLTVVLTLLLLRRCRQNTQHLQSFLCSIFLCVVDILAIVPESCGDLYTLDGDEAAPGCASTWERQVRRSRWG